MEKRLIHLTKKHYPLIPLQKIPILVLELQMTPLDYYHDQYSKGVIFDDPQQLNAMQHLQRVFTEIMTEHQKRQGMLSLFHKERLIKGVYLWGGVGIGKTFMMDCFYHCVTFSEKMRMHFHQFMQLVHQELRKYQGEKDPLQIIAKNFSKQTMLLCFDEFFVSDITDAMLLGRLIKALFLHNVCLVATSNVAPDDLYKNGLQREQFLPAIAMLKQDADVVHIPTAIDYRMRHLKEAGVFYTPLNDAARANIEKSFVSLAGDQPVTTDSITIHNRTIKVKKRTKKIVWFEFEEICSVPRSQMDYLAIAEQFETVFISDIPIIPANEKDTICLFISMIDVFYDAHVRLVISAADSITALYSRGYMTMEYTRTHSRLLEMQSTDYFLAD